eukprot:350561-Chlamydomonas_euryale.AAC.21
MPSPRQVRWQTRKLRAPMPPIPTHAHASLCVAEAASAEPRPPSQVAELATERAGVAPLLLRPSRPPAAATTCTQHNSEPCMTGGPATRRGGACVIVSRSRAARRPLNAGNTSSSSKSKAAGPTARSSRTGLQRQPEQLFPVPGHRCSDSLKATTPASLRSPCTVCSAFLLADDRASFSFETVAACMRLDVPKNKMLRTANMRLTRNLQQQGSDFGPNPVGVGVCPRCRADAKCRGARARARKGAAAADLAVLFFRVNFFALRTRARDNGGDMSQVACILGPEATCTWAQASCG